MTCLTANPLDIMLGKLQPVLGSLTMCSMLSCPDHQMHCSGLELTTRQSPNKQCIDRKKGAKGEAGTKAGLTKRNLAEADTLLQLDAPADWPPELSEGALQGLMLPQDDLLVCSWSQQLSLVPHAECCIGAAAPKQGR